MFFTVRNLEGFVIQADEFIGKVDLFNALLSYLKPKYKVTFTSNLLTKEIDTLGIDVSEIFFPRSEFEANLFQNTIRRAITHIGTKPSSTVYITSSAAYLRAAHEVLVGTMVVVEDKIEPSEELRIFQQFPDFVGNFERCKDTIEGKNAGFGGEFESSPKEIFIFDIEKTKLYQFPSVPNLQHPKCPVYVAGRYFGYQDPRHSIHALSTRIVHSKRNPQIQAKCFAELFALGACFASDNKLDFITRVPARPDELDRLEIYMKEIPTSESFIHSRLDSSILRPDIIACTKKYPKLKTLGHQERKAAVKGMFEVQIDVSGKRIALIDDVQTTGATLNECIGTLLAKGAAEIFPVVLGYHPYELQTLALNDDQELRCGGCNQRLVSRCRNSDGMPFYGCSGWKPNDGIKHTNMDFAPGMKRKLELMEPALLRIDEELDSESIDF